MQLTVKRAFFKHVIYDEAGSEWLYVFHKGGRYQVEDAAKTCLVTLDEAGEDCLTIHGAQLNGSVNIQMKQKATSFLLPCAEQVEVQAGDDRYTITETDQHTVLVLQDGAPVASLCSVAARTTQMNVTVPMNPDLVGLLFVASIVMLHEDDEIIA